MGVLRNQAGVDGVGCSRVAAPKLPISPLVGVEEWSAQRTESQLLGFPNDERPAGQRGARRIANLARSRLAWSVRLSESAKDVLS
ncbi:hypothetical protein BQ8482_140055 [Mesorhizobium delmotii]|uniref:Uncharacterized protein n=1 Tax=Mesorhizobium delmotii TaxID=1631247 RepID=A0A2P9AH04_9HYPH|nr:hypothetical protein BQ8482_140055 [Mesorhizobium delmotii]